MFTLENLEDDNLDQELIDQLVKKACRYGEVDSLENVLLMKLFGTTRRDAEVLGKPIPYEQHTIVSELLKKYWVIPEAVVTGYLMDGEMDKIPNVYGIADIIISLAK